jgi:ABC-type uncharacterized transport system ATPase subunit
MSALTVTNLCKSFGGLHVTTNVNLNVEPGERRLIIGPNGAGKTRSNYSGRTSPVSRAAAVPTSEWRAPIRSSRCSGATPSFTT